MQEVEQDDKTRQKIQNVIGIVRCIEHSKSTGRKKGKKIKPCKAVIESLELFDGSSALEQAGTQDHQDQLLEDRAREVSWGQMPRNRASYASSRQAIGSQHMFVRVAVLFQDLPCLD